MRHLRLASLCSLIIFAVACTEAPVSVAPEAHTHSQAEEALFTNSGFESGNLSGWTTSTALVATSPGVTAYPVTQESQLGLRTGGVNKTSAVNAPSGPYSLVPPGLTSAETARYPRFGNWAAVVNDQGSSYNANKITQNSVVTTADIDPADGLVHVRFVVLPVLQNPGHTVREQPYYYVAINNVTKGTQLTSRFNFSNEAGVPWQSNAAGSIVYTDWLLFDLPLSRNAVSIGDTLQAVIIAGGCAQSGHWGEAIIDSFGSFIPGLVAYGSGPDSVEAGSDFQYTYRVLNGSTVTSTGTELTAYLPAGTTFRSVDTAGITCTTPTVGTRGTVSCNLGAVGAGASSTVKITVRADATATGEIRHGWYFSKSNQEKPLTGPLVTTKVTTGGTTQYVDLVTTVDDATTSLTWGQQNTWAITVLNRGPTTATNARLVTNTPANLNTLTWTCTAQSGASCGSASGTGAIDALATIPAGKSVTWSLKANVNAGLGTGMVSVTANATAPAGTVEQYALDNGSGDDDTLSTLVLPVTVNRQGAGAGELIATPAGLSCGAGCSTVSGNFASGTQVTINAVPAAGSMFTGWTGGTCSGTGACTFTTALAHTVTGTFAKIPTLITSPATANAAVGKPFSYTVTANGTAPIALSATNLPAWATFNPSTGVISGTPTATGSATINLSASDVNGTATQTLTLTIGTAPTITSALTFSVASSGSAWTNVLVTASGSATIQYNASNLPGTVYFNSTTGAFNGSSAANGVFNIPVVATNAFGSDYRTIAVSVGAAPVITSALTSSATVGTAWTYTLTATPSGVTLSTNNLPSWATFNASSGVISGTPTTAGTVSIGVAASNSVGTSSQTLVLTVDGPAVITSALTANGTAGQAFAYTLNAEGTTPITRAVTGLQAWMNFDASTGLLSGTPPAPGTFTVNLSATNAIGSDAKTLTITIAAPPPTPTPPGINSALTASGAVGAAFTYTITASGAVPMTYAATGLPAWASFDAATGTITGTPSEAGSHSINIKATNSLGEDNKTLVITIVSPAVITSALTATAIVGEAFSYTTTASGSGPITFTATGVPAWASFAGGVLSGTPTAEGTVTVALRAENAGGADTKNLVISIRTRPLITSSLSAEGTVGTAFSYTVTASGTAPRTLTTGALPSWASFNASTGVISGTPTVEGSVSINLGVSNAAGSDSKTLTLVVRKRAEVTSPSTADAVVGELFSYTMTATGTAPLTLSATGLPAWASFNASTGVLSGTPSASGSVQVSLTADNAAGSDTRTLTITIRSKPVITSALMADATVGQAFSYAGSATGSATITWSATGLPAWATLNPSTGAITGTPTADVNASIVLTATNAAGSDSKTLNLTVRAKPGITSALAVDAVVGQAFSYAASATGTAPLSWTAPGLPAWATLNPSTGAITGTPTADVDATIALTVTNAAGSDTKNLVITVRAKPSITSALTAIATVGESFSYTVTASGTEPRTLSVAGLPAWASFSNGVITGTPTADVDATIALTVTNAAGTDTKNLVITVRAKPAITSALTATANVGDAFTYTLTATGTEPRTVSVSGLPTWAQFDASTGLISGTPDADVDASIVLTVTNAAGSDSKTLQLTVRAKPSITSALTAIATVDESFSYTLTATGTEPRTLSVGALPSWLHFNASMGQLFGTPTADVDADIALTVTNAAGTDTKTLHITVRAKPAITSAMNAEAIVGQAFTFSVTATGTAPRTLSVSGLPSWLSFDAATGELSGTPSSDVDATLVITVTNAAGSASKNLHITVRARPVVTSVLAAEGIVGWPFSYTLTANGTAPLTLATGMLPGWLSFDAATGVLSGVPTGDAQEAVLVSVSNAAGSDTRTLVITVRTLPVITSASSLVGVEGAPLSMAITTTGTGPIVISATGLPAGLSLVNGVITGTPSAPGHSEVQVTATNGAGTVTQTMVIDVRSPLSVPVIDAPAANAALNTGTVVINGTLPAGEAGGQVKVSDGSTVICTAQVQADGSWSCTATLTEGAHSLTAKLVDISNFEGPSSAARDVRIDLSAPVGPTVTAPGSIVNTGTPTFSGTGEVGARVTVERKGYTVCVALVGADGTWSCTPSMPLPEGASAFAIVQRDAAGNTSATTTVTTTVDVTAPAMPTMTSPVAGSVMGNTMVTFTGTAEAGSTVKVFVDGEERCSAIADANGDFSCSAMLGDGGHQITVTSTDAAGNSTTTAAMNMQVDTTAPAAPMLTTPIGGTSTGTPTYSGTGEPGATVRVVIDGQQACMTTVAANGTWSCTVTSPLSEGMHTVSITITDAAGHTSQSVDGTIDVRGSTGTVTPVTGSVGSNDNGHIEGTATPGATVNVYVDGQLVGTVTADENGHWGFDLPLLGAGEHTVSVGVVGQDGRETPAGETVLTVEQSSFDIGGGGFGCSTSSGSPTWLLAMLLLGALWRRGSKKVAKSVAAVAVATVATTASAQSVEVSGFDLEQLQLNPGARSALVVGGGDVLLPMDFRVAASLGYQHAPLVYFQDGERRAALVENRLTTTLSGAFGVLPWLEVGASVPLVVFQNGQAVTSSRGDMIAGAVPQQVSFGTPWLQARLAPFQERNGAPVDFGVTLAVGIPLGATGSLTSEPYVTGQVIAGAARTVGPVRIALDLGAHLRADRTIAVNDVIGSRLLGGLGVSTINGPLRGEVSLRGFIPLAGESVSAELLGGARYSFGHFEVFGLAGPGIGNAPGTPAFRALVGVSFGGVKSGRCTLQSADPSSCPGLDYDGDGIKNGDDACPMQAGSCAPIAAPVAVEAVKPAEVVESPAAVPVAEPVAEAAPQVELKQDRIEIHGEVHFESGRAVIGSESFPLLNEVAALLNAHPEVKSVRVEGHTDDRGGAAANMKLSKDRAAAVRTYLVKQGVSDARLTSEGYGQTKPVMSNETAAGREKNRRVMFTIEQ